MNCLVGGDTGLGWLASGGNGTTMVGKLEGFQTGSLQEDCVSQLQKHLS